MLTVNLFKLDTGCYYSAPCTAVTLERCRALVARGLMNETRAGRPNRHTFIHKASGIFIRIEEVK